MTEKIYLYLFILCGILCQAIIRVSSEVVDESNSPIRRKRVINLEEGGDIPLSNGEAPYVVNIKQIPGNVNIGVGTILSKHTVITSASSVVHFSIENIEVLVGSSYSYRGSPHRVIEKRIHLGGHHERHWEGVALLIVVPDITFNGNAQSISLHQGPLLPGTPTTIFGWGCNPAVPRGTEYRLRLRFIIVQIMRHRDCVNSYRDHFQISDKDICTYHPNRRCGHTDAGAPLVADNHLAGIYLWSGKFPGQINPDVFADIQNLEYGPWIRNNIVYNI